MWKLKLTHEGASLYLLLGPDLEGGVARAKDYLPPNKMQGRHFWFSRLVTDLNLA